MRDAARAKEIMMQHLGRVRVDEEAVCSVYPQYIKQAKG